MEQQLQHQWNSSYSTNGTWVSFWRQQWNIGALKTTTHKHHPHR
jgi:hypothetical protein